MGKKKALNKSAEAKTQNICSRTTSKRKSKKGMDEENKPVCDSAEKKSGKEYFSRCSPAYFQTVMGELKPILGEQQISRINETPFAKWIDIPALAISSGRIDYFLNRFQGDSCSFVVGDDIIVPFKSADFSVVIGLQHSGQQVDLDLRLDSTFLTRHFDGKVSNAKRIAIYQKLMFLARSDDDRDIDDFVRTFILLIFNCIIFPTGNYITPGFIFPYLDDLTMFSKYAWGDAAFRFLYREICQLGKKLYVDGCTVGLMAWLYETVPVLGVRRGLNIFPRLFAWARSKIPLNATDTASLLKRIDSTQVLSIRPFFQEEELVVPMNNDSKQEADRSEVKRFERLLVKQRADIKILVKRCAELEAEQLRRSTKGKMFVVDESRNKVESEKKVDSSKEKVNIEPAHDASAHFADFVDVVVHEVVCDLATETNELDGSDFGNRSGDESSDRSVAATSEVLKKTVLKSSIVDNVRTRADRVKKKDYMFVTPPSSTPRRRRKVRKQEYVDVEIEGKTPGKLSMVEFQGRSDFCGHEEADVADMKLVTNFLARQELDVVVWRDEFISLSGPILCRFLFGAPMESEIINVYMRIMQKKSFQQGSEIYCMDTFVQNEVLSKLKEHGRRMMVQQADYGAFLAKMTSFTMIRLQELNEDLLRRCRYIIFPLNERWHWFLLVYIRDERKFKLWNSMHDPFGLGTAKAFTKFLAGSIRHLSGFDLVSEAVVREPCRQQGATLDCGVYACMWLECLSRDTDDIWRYAEDVKMDTYRARMAVTILSDENGLLENKFE